MALSWTDILEPEEKKPYFKALMTFLAAQTAEGKTIFPPKSLFFEALKQTPFDTIKAVILGQDPYHRPNQAHGLCFSVLPGTRPPPSLKNIFKELISDLSLSETPKHGCLTAWAEEGVLLLNTTLSVEQSKPQSHAGKGWETFTDVMIDAINREHRDVVFLLWGSHAHQKSAHIDPNKHHIIKTTHPSPFSAYRGFLGSKPFSNTNAILEEKGKKPINWAAILS